MIGRTFCQGARFEPFRRSRLASGCVTVLRYVPKTNNKKSPTKYMVGLFCCRGIPIFESGHPPDFKIGMRYRTATRIKQKKPNHLHGRTLLLSGHQDSNL